MKKAAVRRGMMVRVIAAADKVEGEYLANEEFEEMADLRWRMGVKWEGEEDF